MASSINLIPALGVATTAVAFLLGFIYRELRAIHKQQAAQGTLLLLVVEQDADSEIQVPDELRDGVLK